MNNHDIKRLNRRLGDLSGKNPSGDPIYRWVHSRDLVYPINVGGGTYTQMRQIDEDRWIIAKWLPPMPEGQWKAQFPDIGYPHQGMYYATDVMLVDGAEPNDGITESVAGRLKATECRTFRDCLEEIERSRERRELANKTYIGEFMDDACVAFNNVPGKRGGHVSFGGIDSADQSNH